MIADAVARSQLRLRTDRRQWVYMIGLSLLIHSAVIIGGTAWPDLFPSRRSFGPVYSVELVSLPEMEVRAPRRTTAVQRASRAASKQRALPLPRFRAKQQKPVLQKMKTQPPLQKLPERKVVESRVKKLPQKPPAPTARPRENAARSPGVQAGKKKVSLVNIGGMKGEDLSQALGLYRALVYDKVESNWVLPERLVAGKDHLEAVVVVRVKRDGTVTQIRFEKKSGDPYFDDSVLKAVLKSKPFPPFPDIYSPREEEIVLRFSPENGS
ncbi:MAG: TonB family protein [Deltaproteobacteria bacterium]|nr:TonB family protein [Deltaproteobacteria bacterium]MBW2070105.1 TonB family protein [Deltaproteobacteria bacterium]